MREPDSLDEESLNDDPPEYQHPEDEIIEEMRELTSKPWHPEDLIELYRKYERTIDERYPSDS